MRAFLAGVVIMVGQGSCFAADLPSRQSPPSYVGPVALPTFTWTGAYVGLNVGYIGGTSRYDYTVAPEGNPVIIGSESKHGDGVIGGAQVGYNYALGNVVIGAEADFDGSSMRSAGVIGGLLFTGTTATLTSRTNYVGTARGRFGYAFDRLLVYGTGGFAYANVRATAVAPEIGMATGNTTTHTGYAVGGGIEFAVTRNLLLRAEYLRIDCGKREIARTDDENLAYRFTERPVYNVARVGLSYLFSAPVAAVVARY